MRITLFAIAVVLVLSACVQSGGQDRNSGGPSVVTEDYVRAIVSFDFAKARSYATGTAASELYGYDGLGDLGMAASQLINISSFAVVNEKVIGNDALVRFVYVTSSLIGRETLMAGETRLIMESNAWKVYNSSVREEDVFMPAGAEPGRVANAFISALLEGNAPGVMLLSVPAYRADAVETLDNYASQQISSTPLVWNASQNNAAGSEIEVMVIAREEKSRSGVVCSGTQQQFNVGLSLGAEWRVSSFAPGNQTTYSEQCPSDLGRYT